MLSVAQHDEHLAEGGGATSSVFRLQIETGVDTIPAKMAVICGFLAELNDSSFY